MLFFCGSPVLRDFIRKRFCSEVRLAGWNGCGCAVSSIDNPAEVCHRSDPGLNAGDLPCQTELESLEGTVHCGQILQAWESLPHGACLFWPSIVFKGQTLCHKHTDIS